MPFRALIVEDDTSFRELLELRLHGWREDLDIRIAETIAKGRELLESAKEPFDLVIIDQRLPDGVGKDLLNHPALEYSAVLAVSADNAPELPGEAVRAGAQHFLGKLQVSEPLFVPLLEALVHRKHLERALVEAKVRESKMSTIKTLLATLRHEINNPLGAVLGGTYLLRTSGTLDTEQTQALKVIEASGNRIKHVLKQLCETAELEEVSKAREQLFQVPGDAPWEKKK